MTSMYELTVSDSSGRCVLLRYACYGETPNVGDLVTVHPDGEPSEDSLTARVSGVQRVLKPVVDAPGAPRRVALSPTHVAVTARTEA